MPAPRRLPARRLPVLLSAVLVAAWSAVAAGPALAAGSVSLTTLDAAYTQDFDTLALSGSDNTTVPPGWDFRETGTNANTAYRAGTGSDTDGDTYSFGAALSARARLRRPAQRNARPHDWRPVHEQHRRDGQHARRRVYRRAVAPRPGRRRARRRPARLPSVHGRDLARDRDLDGPRRPRLREPRRRRHGRRRPQRERRAQPDGALPHDLRPVDPRRRDVLAPVVGRRPRPRRRRRPWHRRLLPHSAGSSWCPTTPRRSPRRSRRTARRTSRSAPTCPSRSASRSPSRTPGSRSSAASSGAVAASFSGGPTTFTIDPDAPLADGESCTLTVLASAVQDVDGNDPPDEMVASFVVGFSPYDVCLDPFTPAYQIQGSGLSAATTGTVTTEGVVVGDFEGTAANSGFFLQDPDGRRRCRHLGRHLRVHRQREPRERRPGRAGHGLRPRALQHDDAQRLQQQHGARPGLRHRRLRHRERPRDGRDPAVREHGRPRALRGDARALPAVARHQRVLQLRPVRRARARAAPRRRAAAVQRHGARRARRSRATREPRPTRSAGSPSTTRRARRTRRSSGIPTATPFTPGEPVPGRRPRRERHGRPRLRLQPVPDLPDRPAPTTRRRTRDPRRPSRWAARSARRR